MRLRFISAVFPKQRKQLFSPRFSLFLAESISKSICQGNIYYAVLFARRSNAKEIVCNTLQKNLYPHNKDLINLTLTKASYKFPVSEETFIFERRPHTEFNLSNFC